MLWRQLLLTLLLCGGTTQAFVAFPRGGSFGYLAAVALPLDLPNRNVYISFNFESNYGLPPNDSYYTWIQRWNLDNENLGLGGNVTSINGRSQGDGGVEPQAQEQRKDLKGEADQKQRQDQLDDQQHRRSVPVYTRHGFYSTLVGYFEHYGFNGTACLWRAICDVAAAQLHVANGLLGSIFRVLFVPTSTAPEQLVRTDFGHAYTASWRGETRGDCGAYTTACPNGLLDLISTFY